MSAGSLAKDHRWIQEFPFAITVVDTRGVILAMNEKSVETFSADGGAELIGKNSLDCHPEPSRTKLRQLLEDPRANIYTIEKAGQKKLICQAPWFEKGKFSGIVELSIELPPEVPHFVRS